MKKFRNLQAILLTLGVLFLSACSSSNTTYTYAGAGSAWTATLTTGGSFTLTETTADPDLVINGTYTQLETGFLKMTVSSASGTGAPSAGSQAYALNIPGVVLIVKPIGSGSNQIIPMVTSGNCPSGDVQYNWIDMALSTSTYTVSSTNFAGTFSLSGTSASLPSRYAADGTSIGSQSLGTFSCSNGIGTLSGDADVKMYLTQSSGAIVHSPNVPMVVFATAKTSLSGFSALAGNYAGVVFSTDDYAVSMSMDSSGNMTVQSINPDTGAQAGDITSTVLAPTGSVNNPADGMILYQFQSATSEKVICIAAENLSSSGKSTVFCAGDEPGTSGETGTQGKMFTALFIEK